MYNKNHPYGSDSYGTAITSLPMKEAVPDDNVFLRSKLWGTGERNIQNFSFITVENSSVTITKVAGQMLSDNVTIIPTVFPRVDSALFNYKILDYRGLSVIGAVVEGDAGDNPPFIHPTPVIATVRGEDLEINANSGQITSQKSIGVEVSREGAAPAFVTVTINVNNNTN